MTPRRFGACFAARLAAALSGTPIVLCVLSGIAMLSGIATPAAALDFTAEEKRRILRHGPWPPASRPDPSNRVSGQPAAVAFEPHAGGERILRRLDLSARERADLVAFLETLTEEKPLHESLSVFVEKNGNAVCR